MILRKKLRYLLVESSDAIRTDSTGLQDSLKQQMRNFLGELAYFKANPQFVTQLSGNVFVLSVSRGYEKNVVLALSFVKNLGGPDLGLYTIRTSGSMRSIRSAFRKLY